MTENSLQEAYIGAEKCAGFEYLLKPLAEALTKFSVGTKIAFCEAEYWGGQGSKSAALWEDGELVKTLKFDGQAFNEVLRFLGIESVTDKDEFDVVNWGRYRKTQDWVPN